MPPVVSSRIAPFIDGANLYSTAKAICIENTPSVKSAGERCAMVLVIAGISVVWGGVVWVAATLIWG